MRHPFLKIAGLAAMGIGALILLSFLVKAIVIIGALALIGKAAARMWHGPRRGRQGFGPQRYYSELQGAQYGYGQWQQPERSTVQARPGRSERAETIVPIY